MMSLLEILTLGLGAAGFILAIISLILGKKWSDRAWKRDSRIPFYIELGQFSSDVLGNTLDEVLKIPTKPLDFHQHIIKARALGLTDLADALKEWSSLYYQQRLTKSKSMGGDLKEARAKVQSLITADLNKIHKKSK